MHNMNTPQPSPLVSVKKCNTYLVKFRQKGLKLLTTDCIISFVFYTMFTKRWIILWKNEKN